MFQFSVQFSHSVVSNSLGPHELQDDRPPCPSPTTGVYPNSCPLSQWCHLGTTRKDSESEWLAQDNPETNPITIKPKTVSYVAGLFSWFPLPCCPFPIKSPALSAHESPWTIHFWVLDKSPVSGPGRGPPSCNSIIRKDRILEFYATQATRTWETKMPERIKCV